MNHRLKPYAVLLFLSIAAVGEVAGQFPAEGFEIHLAGVNEREERVADLLVGLSHKHDLSPWLFTDRVRIESGVIPHSHPILTLNTLYVQESTQLLAVFLHEQIHRFLAAPGNRNSVNNAVSELREMYAQVPDAENGGAASEDSTYRHFLVNWLEFDALSNLLGRTKAREVIEERRIYPWIYGKVLEDSDQLKSVVTRNDLAISHERR